MSESLTYGTGGGRLGNHRLYPEADAVNRAADAGACVPGMAQS
jgi:hypothetical protein